MCDKLVFDLAQEIEGSPSVFVRKDWLNILDNQNQNYNNNQSVIDTSQLSNSNKWLNYREAYLSIPMLMSIGLTGTTQMAVQPFGGVTEGQVNLPAFNTSSGAQSIDYAYGLKNWFGSIIHSFTLDYNGTTIIQQTPYTNMWNSFRLMTSLSYGDLITQGDTIGFFPDDSASWEFCLGAGYAQGAAGAATTTLGTGYIAPLFRSGCGVCNNTALNAFGREGGLDTNTQFNNYNSGSGNPGLIRRIQNINFNVLGISASQSLVVNNTAMVDAPSTAFQPSFGQGCYGFCYGDQLQGGGKDKLPNTVSSVGNVSSTMGLLWKSYVSAITAYNQQTSIVATVYLKHIHSFFNMVPLLKGVFMKMTMNLNNSSATVNCISYKSAATAFSPLGMTCSSVSVPTGGVLPFMITSPIYAQSSGATGTAGSINLFPKTSPVSVQGTWTGCTFTYTLNLSVGATCLNQTLSTQQTLGAGTTVLAPPVGSGALSKSVYLYIPAYTFNPPFESSYLSSPVKVIKYTDIYQYQVLNIGAGQQFNNLVTNGIANIKSVLILPFYSSSAGGTPLTMPLGFGASGNYIPAVSLSPNTGFLSGTPVFQSPFDPAGTGPTSPMVYLTNFNVQVSGQNAIYNVEKYNFEQFNNQLYGQNSVNGGLTDGLTSGLVGRTDFDMEYCYYYVNVERMLPVEESVPKSIQILGTNLSSRAIDFYVFIEYGMEIKIDALTGARV